MVTNKEFKKVLESRTEDFAVDVFRMLDALPRKNSTKIISCQLGRSASSIGANYREANRAESADDFAHKLNIALKESSERSYWLSVLGRLYPQHKVINALYNESDELTRILFSAIRTCRMARTHNS